MSDPQLPPVDPDEIESDDPDRSDQPPNVASEGAALLARPGPQRSTDDADIDEDVDRSD